MPGDEDLDPDAAPPVPPVAPPAPAVPPAAPPAPPVAPAAPPVAPISGLPENERRALIADHSARAERKLLKKLFGTDDPAEVERIRAEQQQRLDQQQQMVVAEEERKRAQMSEVERLNADVARLTEENTQLKAKLQRVEGDKVAAQQDATIKGIAVNFIQPKWIKYAMNEFRDYVISLTLVEQKKVDERRTSKWFGDFAKREPLVALEAPKPAAPLAPPPEAPPALAPGAPSAPIVRRPPLAAGARPPGLQPKPNAAPPNSDPFAGYTPLPGKPNSMSKDMLRSYAKHHNLPYPG